MGARLNGRGDLGAGCLATVALAVLVLVLRLHPLLAAVLAVAIYLGASFLRLPSPSMPPAPWDAVGRRWGRWQGQWTAGDTQEATAEERAHAAAFARARDLRALAPRIAKPAVRDLVGRILDWVDRILAAMTEDQDLGQIPGLDTCLLEPLHDLLSTYLRLAQREVVSAGDVLARIESHDLPLILEAVEDVYERLHGRHLTDLATMSELMALNLESVRAMTRRRAAP